MIHIFWELTVAGRGTCRWWGRDLWDGWSRQRDSSGWARSSAVRTAAPTQKSDNDMNSTVRSLTTWTVVRSLTTTWTVVRSLTTTWTVVRSLTTWTVVRSLTMTWTVVRSLTMTWTVVRSLTMTWTVVRSLTMTWTVQSESALLNNMYLLVYMYFVIFTHEYPNKYINSKEKS